MTRRYGQVLVLMMICVDSDFHRSAGVDRCI